MASEANNLPGEVWKAVRGYEDRYEVSNLGRIKSLPFALELMTRWGSLTTRHTAEKVMSLQVAKNGYVMVHLKVGGQRVAKYVHRLVCEAFHGAPPVPRMEVAHGDGSRANNRASNLRWVTSSENSQDMIRHGRSIRGNRHPTRKLNENAVRQIRSLRNAERDSEFAKRYGVTKGTIRRVRLGHSWGWMN